MTLPTFLGIGAPRSGSTWLHNLLASHPDIFVPTRRKEVRFFDLYYERGLDWYEKFFPTPSEAGQYQAIGEISPGYLYCPGCPERIASVPSVKKLLLILRNPADRAYSAYGRRVRFREFTGLFEDLLRLEPEVIELGFYSSKIEEYLHHFEKEQILVLIFEHAVADVAQTKEILARFLGVSTDRFPLVSGNRSANRGYVPKAKPIPHSWASYIHLKLLDWDLDWIIAFTESLEKRFGEASPLYPMKEETRRHLGEIYADEIGALESLLQVRLESWYSY